VLTKPMSGSRLWLLFGGLAAAGLMTWSSSSRAAGPRPALSPNALRSAHLRLPLAFEPNQGQAGAGVTHVARTSGATLLVGQGEATLRLQRPATVEPEASPRTPRARRRNARVAAGPVSEVTMRFVGAQPNSTMKAEQPLPGKVNYLIGNDPSRWRRNIPTFAQVRCEDVYPGVDVAYYGNGRQLEYDVVVRPGADPKVVRLDVDGAERLTVDAAGDLLIETAGGTLRQQRPVAYQEVNGERKPVEVRYALNDRRLTFDLGEYDSSRELVIDPLINIAGYIGGSGDDLGAAVGVDADGNAYITGTTTSVNFPTNDGALQTTFHGISDVFVTKVNAAGTSLVYSTYVGGTGADSAQAIAVDAAGHATVAGDTTSTDFPTTGGQENYAGNGDAFVFRLAPDGDGVFATFIGGSDSDIANGVALDGAGNAYVVGWTASNNLPAAVNSFGGQADAFVTKVEPSEVPPGQVGFTYTRYVGGADFDVGFGIAVDPTTNEAVIIGDTFSNNASNFPLLGAIQNSFGGVADAFVSRINAAGTALVFSTYFGGKDFDSGRAVTLDAAGNVIITGTTYSDAVPVTGEGFPIASAFQPALNGSADAYVAKLSPAGNTLAFSTYLGGSVVEGGFALDVDEEGNVWVAGETESGDFPTVQPAQAYFGGGAGANPTDGFVTQVAADGQSLLFSSYLGGEGNDTVLGISAVDVDVAYVTGVTASTEFPVTGNGGGLAGPTDAFLVRLGGGAGVPLAPTNLMGTATLTSISLSWQDNSDNETGFELERRAGGEDFSLLATTTGTTYVDTDVEPLETYVYRVRAVNATGASPYSNQLSVTVPTTIPAAPTGLTATLIGDNEIRLNWIDNADNEDAYKIERKEGDGGFELIDLLLPNSTEYSDTTVAAGKVYTYRVIASNAMGDSAPAEVGPIEGYSGGKIKVTPKKAKFPKVKAGPVPIGKKKKKKITISNTSKKEELRGTVLPPVEPFYVVSGVSPNGSFTIRPKKKIKITIEFAPEEADNYKETLTITSTDPKKPVVTIPLIGVGK
jgi:hypothetical protein